MLTQTQWIIGIAAVLLLGGLVYYFYSKGEFGTGAPSNNPLGHRRKECVKGGCSVQIQQGMSCNTGVLQSDNECEMGICKGYECVKSEKIPIWNACKNEGGNCVVCNQGEGCLPGTCINGGCI